MSKKPGIQFIEVTASLILSTADWSYLQGWCSDGKTSPAMLIQAIVSEAIRKERLDEGAGS